MEKKKGPGRPPKARVTETILKGIVNSPTIASGNILEIACAPPQILKTIFNYLKSNKIETVHLHCTPKRITFIARNSDKNSDILIDIDPTLCLFYYCRGTVSMTFDEKIYKPFTCIDKTTTSTRIYTTGKTEFVDVSLLDGEMNKEGLFTLACVRAPVTWDPEKILNINYKKSLLSWKMTSKNFKKTITDLHNSDEQFSVCCSPNDDMLGLSYKDTNINYTEMYKEPQKIHLKKNISETFLRWVKISDIKQIFTISCQDVNITFYEDDIYSIVLRDNYITMTVCIYPVRSSENNDVFI